VSSDSFNRSRDRKGGLGSLAQSARGKQLRNAKGILLFVGGWLLFNAILVWFMNSNELEKLQGRRDIDQAALQREWNFLYVLVAGFVVLGITYLVFGFIVKKHPVPITITGMVLFIGFLLITAAIHPANLLAGILVKVIVIVGLAKSIQSAIAYQRERDDVRSIDEEEDYQPSRRRERDERDDLEDEEDRPRRRRADEDDEDDDRPRSRRRDNDEDDELRRRARSDW
jgi:hypothetical protein